MIPATVSPPGYDARHHTEERQAGREVEGAVDRIDDDREIGTGELVEERRIGGDGFLADEHGPRRNRVDIRLDQPLGGLVAFRHQVDRFRLHPHIAGAEIAKARKDFLYRRFLQQVGKCGDVDGMAHSLGSGERD